MRPIAGIESVRFETRVVHPVGTGGAERKPRSVRYKIRNVPSMCSQGHAILVRVEQELKRPKVRSRRGF